MHNGQMHHDASPQSASVSAYPDRHLHPEPESDYQSDDDLDTASRNGIAGSKRKRPISVSYVCLLFPCLARLYSSVIFRLHRDLVATSHQTPLSTSLPPLGTWRRHPMSA